MEVYIVRKYHHIGDCILVYSSCYTLLKRKISYFHLIITVRIQSGTGSFNPDIQTCREIIAHIDALISSLYTFIYIVYPKKTSADVYYYNVYLNVIDPYSIF